MPLNIAKLHTLHLAATPGPWEYDGMHNEIQTPRGEQYWLIISECRSSPDQELPDKLGHSYDANFDFIAYVRSPMGEVLAELSEARAIRAGAG